MSSNTMAISALNGNKALRQIPDSVDHPSSQGSNIQQFLTWGLGVFWVLAGILQFQPLMFTPDFYAWYPDSIMESIIQTAADGQPHVIESLVHAGSTVWSTHPILFNALAATLQLGIGTLLIFGRHSWKRFGLILSITWGFVVWSMGEAFGSVFGGSNYFDGFPGAAVLYVISSLILLVLWRKDNARSMIQTTLRYLVSIYWVVVAVLQILPRSGFWDPSGLVEPFANSASLPESALFTRPVQQFAIFAQAHADTINALIIVLMITMVVLTWFSLWNPLTMTLAALWLIWSWWFGQGFGSILTGAGTDVNSIPIVALWMVCLWRVRSRSKSE